MCLPDCTPEEGEGCHDYSKNSELGTSQAECLGMCDTCQALPDPDLAPNLDVREIVSNVQVSQHNLFMHYARFELSIWISIFSIFDRPERQLILD